MVDIRLLDYQQSEVEANLGSWHGKTDVDYDPEETGIDCLLVLVRFINASLPVEEMAIGVQEAKYTGMGNDKFLQWSWDSLDDLDTQHRDEKEELVQSLGFDTLASATFQQLVSCNAMKSTMWSRPEHAMFSRMVKPPGLGWRKEDLMDNDPVRIDRGDGLEPLDLDVQVQGKCFAIEESADGTKSCLLPNAPVYVRVEYTPAACDGAQTLETLQVLHLRNTQDKPRKTDDGVDRSQNRYILIAAVRLRENAADSDRIRLFAADGTDLKMYTGTGDDCWDIGEMGRTYFLLYGRSDWPVVELSKEERFGLVAGRWHLNETPSETPAPSFETAADDAMDQLPPPLDASGKPYAAPTDKQPRALPSHMTTTPAKSLQREDEDYLADNYDAGTDIDMETGERDSLQPLSMPPPARPSTQAQANPDWRPRTLAGKRRRDEEVENSGSDSPEGSPEKRLRTESPQHAWQTPRSTAVQTGDGSPTLGTSPSGPPSQSGHGPSSSSVGSEDSHNFKSQRTR